MIPDRGNQAFVAFVGACVGAFTLLALGACMMLGIVGYRVQQGGIEAIAGGRSDVRPALLFLAVVVGGVLAALWSLRRQLLATRRLAGRVRAMRLDLPPRLARAAARMGVPDRVDFIDVDESFSFTFGLVRPRIAVSRGLVESVSAPELGAVLEHERYHVRHLDPLRILVTRSSTPALFFIPALRDVRARYAAGRELAADRRAIFRHGRVPLAGALYKVLTGPGWLEFAPAAALGGGDALEARVTQIETGHEPPAAPMSRGAIALSAGGALALLSSFALAVYLFGGPAALARLCNGSA